MPKSKQQKQEEAQARHEARAARSDFDQLERLIARGHGFSREAVRLRARISEQAEREEARLKRSKVA